MISVCACESQPVVIEGLCRSLEKADDLRFGGAVSSPESALEMIERERPRVLLLDKSFGSKAIFEILGAIKARELPTGPILWAPEVSEVESFRALQAGVRGILKKTLPISIVLDCARTVAKGNLWVEDSVSDQCVGFVDRRSAPRLTPREDEILRLAMRGLKNKQIADALGITTGTVKVHLMHIFEKTGVKDRFELAMYGRKLRGFVTGPEEDRFLSAGPLGSNYRVG